MHKSRSIKPRYGRLLTLAAMLIASLTISDGSAADEHGYAGALSYPSGCRVTSRPNDFEYRVSFVGMEVLESGAASRDVISEAVEAAITAANNATELDFNRSDSKPPHGGALLAVRVTPFSLVLPSDPTRSGWDLIRGPITSTTGGDETAVLPPKTAADSEPSREFAAVAECSQVRLEAIGKLECAIERFGDRAKRLQAAIVYVGINPIVDYVGPPPQFDVIATSPYITMAVTRCLEHALYRWIGPIGIVSGPE